MIFAKSLGVSIWWHPHSQDLKTDLCLFYVETCLDRQENNERANNYLWFTDNLGSIFFLKAGVKSRCQKKDKHIVSMPPDSSFGMTMTQNFMDRGPLHATSQTRKFSLCLSSGPMVQHYWNDGISVPKDYINIMYPCHDTPVKEVRLPF